MKLFGYTSDGIEEPRYLTRPHPKKQKFCIYCRTPLGADNYSRDHLYPKSKGGRRTKPCCITCNQEKKDMTIREYIAYLQSMPPTGLILNKISNAGLLIKNT